ncbi:MAG: MBL fold metallo-hydrolase [candidate division Zixibacteria bacterium]|nr:MBL fold metallo-hydrolase [candidate division Zixibacteria bacterium]
MSKKLKTIVVGPFEVNCYLYWDDVSNEGVIIDPGSDEQRILAGIKKTGFIPRAILLTHGHVDHIEAAAAVKDAYNIPVYIGKGEEALLGDATLNMSTALGKPMTAPPADFTLVDEELILFGALMFTILSTPGHSPASICYLDESEGIVFSGDALFQGSIGRTDFPGCSYERLVDSIHRKLMRLPDGVICYPGHGSKTTIGAERHSNPFLIRSSYA